MAAIRGRVNMRMQSQTTKECIMRRFTISLVAAVLLLGGVSVGFHKAASTHSASPVVLGIIWGDAK